MHAEKRSSETMDNIPSSAVVLDNISATIDTTPTNTNNNLQQNCLFIDEDEDDN
jgi:hypothetical protein